MSRNSKDDLLQEAKVRGLCAAYSADMEALLLKIILYCIVGDASVAFREFRTMTLGSKLGWAQKDLSKYFPSKYADVAKHFDWLWQFNEYRGRLIHGDIQWIDNDYNNFYILDIQQINGEWRINPIHHTITDVGMKLADFGKLIIEFADTAHDIIQEVSKKYPELIKSAKA